MDDEQQLEAAFEFSDQCAICGGSAEVDEGALKVPVPPPGWPPEKAMPGPKAKDAVRAGWRWVAVCGDCRTLD
jgi:hypothetical protein